MWAYGAPEVWPDGVTTGKDSDGETTYHPATKSFRERIFGKKYFLSLLGENSLPFFILL